MRNQHISDPMIQRVRRYARRGFSLIPLLAFACGGDPGRPGPTDPEKLFWRLSINHRAVTLSLTPPYDTLTLVATPFNPAGIPLPTDAQVTWKSLDEAVDITPQGQLKANLLTTGSAVVAAMTIGTMTLTDTMRVAVIDSVSPGKLTRISLWPNSDTLPRLECFSFLYNGPYAFAPELLDNNNNPITDALVAYRSSDVNVVEVYQTGELNFLAIPCEVGRPVTLSIEATYLGVRMRDSLRLTTSDPGGPGIRVLSRVSPTTRAIEHYFSPNEVTIPVGGIVAWGSERVPFDIEFEDPSAAFPTEGTALFYVPTSTEGGNIPSFLPDTADKGSPANFRARRFLKPGTYKYRSHLISASGTIIVRPQTPVPIP